MDGPHSIGSQLFLNFIQVWKELAYLGGHHAAEVHSSPAFGAVARCAADVCKIVANDELKAIDVKELKSAAINFNDLALLLTQFCELTKKHKFGNTVNVKPKDVVAKLKDANSVLEQQGKNTTNLSRALEFCQKTATNLPIQVARVEDLIAVRKRVEEISRQSSDPANQRSPIKFVLG